MEKPDLSAGLSIEPKKALGCVVLFHEVWGLTDHMRETCKQVGKLGFAAKAPNLFRDYGELLTPANVEKAMQVVWALTLEERRDARKIQGALAKKRPGPAITEVVTTLYNSAFRSKILDDATALVEEAASKFGGASTLGFSFGGGISLRVATKTKSLRSAVAYYAEPPKHDDVRTISAPMLAIYAGEDEFINRYIPDFAQAAHEARKDLTLKILPGVKHGFFDPMRKDAYNKRAATEAWNLTKRFLGRTLGANTEGNPSKE